ncbi:MAG: translation initiation factor IF-6 [Euryarchaeota archaeon]|nr:translation initiation factor IF-6 [Euryarchaeota archaeon]|tara:strand:- start:515 stop:1180 length:666 start_codon:yes stop_codon:yes gene_type:complete
MAIVTSDILGSDQVGVYLAVCGDVLFHPQDLASDITEKMATSLELETCSISIGGSSLIGSLMAGTKKGLAIADIATDSDIDKLTSYGDVVVMEGGVNTAGNLIVCNSEGAVLSPAIPEDGVEIISEVFGIPAIVSSIASDDVVGSLAVANDQGVLLHPDVHPDEAKLMEETLGVPAMVGTVSFGSPFVGAGICSSNKGVVVGSETTGPELNRIEDALGLIQ